MTAKQGTAISEHTHTHRACGCVLCLPALSPCLAGSLMKIASFLRLQSIGDAQPPGLPRGHLSILAPQPRSKLETLQSKV